MSWNVHYDQIMYRRDVGCRLLSERLKKEILEEIWVRADAPHNSPLQRQQGNWSRNASRSCFWDRYWGPRRSAIGQFFSSPRSLCERQVNSAQFPSRRITAGCNSQSTFIVSSRFVKTVLFFSQYVNNAQGYNIRYASKQNLYKSKVRTIYNSGKQTVTYTATITREILLDLKHLSVLNFSKTMKLRLPLE